MFRSLLFVLALGVVMPMSAAAQAAPYQEGSVWDLSFIRVQPGMGDEYLNNLPGNWRRSMEAMKAQGVVTSYKLISSEPATHDDWGLLLMVEFPNMAAFDRTELEGCEANHLATLHIGLGEPVDQPRLGRGERSNAGGSVKPLQGERPPGAMANEPLNARSVLALDADGAVNRKAAGPPATCACPPRRRDPGGHGG